VIFARHTGILTSPTTIPARPTTIPTRVAAILLAAACLLAGGGCATVRPGPIAASELAEAQTFPYYPVYWVGPRFDSYPLAAADGRESYNSIVGDSVYYGDCLAGKSPPLGGGGCQLPLQVTTAIYVRHANAPLGPQRNVLLRGVPATIYDDGQSIQLYSGQLAIEIHSDDLSKALRAVSELRPVNAPGSAVGPLPPPVFCPGLTPARPAQVKDALAHLPGRACQRAAAALAAARVLFGKQ
jgi:hypothetical protein